jgi:glycosyltransferase involved in cell wall biosynthesis
MAKARVLILVVSFHAEDHIERVLGRIPEEIWNSSEFETEVLIIDDASADRTFLKAEMFAREQARRRLTVLFNPRNLGYGGNQKVGYHYAVQNGFDAVVLLHGDGQYPPELLSKMLEPVLRGEADAVFGSRMLKKRDALKGGMPLYKWVGNQILTRLQNRIMGSRLSEFHSGYRAYRVTALASVPFSRNSDYFDFDTDIIIQLLQTGKRIREIPIPTFYGEEICRVDGIRYGALVVAACLRAQIMRLGIFHDPRFDYESQNTHYTSKFGYPSSHQLALDLVRPGSTVLDIGCGPGFMAAALRKKSVSTISVDRYVQAQARENSMEAIEADIDEYGFELTAPKVDTVLALDIIEHLRSPEAFLSRLRARLSRHQPQVVLTTGNIAFLPVRLALLLGAFNYGKRGILDLDHTRLFTFGSLRRALETTGYEILETRGIPAPFPLALGPTWLARALTRLNCALIRLSRGMFSYQIAIVARPKPTLEHLLENALEGRVAMLNAMRAASAPNPESVAAIPTTA